MDADQCQHLENLVQLGEMQIMPQTGPAVAAALAELAAAHARIAELEAANARLHEAYMSLQGISAPVARPDADR